LPPRAVCSSSCQNERNRGKGAGSGKLYWEEFTGNLLEQKEGDLTSESDFVGELSIKKEGESENDRGWLKEMELREE